MTACEADGLAAEFWEQWALGHFIFCVLHLISLFAFAAALVLTIPLHLIYAVLSSRAKDQREQADQARREQVPQVACPECRESVRWDALKCKHCGAKLTPLSAPPQVSKQQDTVGGIAVAIVTLVIMVVLAKACS